MNHPKTSIAATTLAIACCIFGALFIGTTWLIGKILSPYFAWEQRRIDRRTRGL